MSLTKQEVANKVDEEGGIYNALHWGLMSLDIEDPELAAAWKKLEDMMPLFHAVADMLPQPEYDDPWQGEWEKGPWL